MVYWRQMPNNQNMTIQVAQQNFLKHAALELHYERLKMANANDHSKYYQYAERQYFHKSRAIHYKGYFSAEAFM